MLCMIFKGYDLESLRQDQARVIKQQKIAY